MLCNPGDVVAAYHIPPNGYVTALHLSEAETFMGVCANKHEVIVLYRRPADADLAPRACRNITCMFTYQELPPLPENKAWRYLGSGLHTPYTSDNSVNYTPSILSVFMEVDTLEHACELTTQRG